MTLFCILGINANNLCKLVDLICQPSKVHKSRRILSWQQLKRELAETMEHPLLLITLSLENYFSFKSQN